MTDELPTQGQRILAKMLDGNVRIANYCRFCWEHWKIKEWKSMPNGQAER